MIVSPLSDDICSNCKDLLDLAVIVSPGGVAYVWPVRD
jgi:hypothetical protein